MTEVWVNRHAFEQRVFDSGALGGLCMVAHQLAEPGLFRGSVTFDESVRASFLLKVDDIVEDMQADIDISKLAGTKAQTGFSGEPNFAVKTGGYVVLHATEGPPGYRVTLSPMDAKKDSKVAPYDSGKLELEDRFVVTLLRSGEYAARVPSTKIEAKIVVGEIKPLAGRPYKPGDPRQVAVTARAFDPKAISINPLEGLIFVAQGADRIVIELLKPAMVDDPKKKKTIRWVNARSPLK